MSLFKKIATVSIAVKDWEGAKKFYGETLGLPVAFDGDAFRWMQYGFKGGAEIALNPLREGQVTPTDNNVVIVFIVADPRKTVEELRARGVRCDDAVTIPEVGVTYATFYDPEGNKLQVIDSNQPD